MFILSIVQACIPIKESNGAEMVMDWALGRSKTSASDQVNPEGQPRAQHSEGDGKQTPQQLRALHIYITR
jgi:hypothetical protein